MLTAQVAMPLSNAASKRPERLLARDWPRGRLEVHGDPAAIDEDWACLEAMPGSTIYQSRRFLLPWLASVGAAEGITPFFVVGRDRSGEPLCILPLGRKRVAGLHVATFLGGRDSNMNCALVRDGASLGREDMLALLRTAAALGRLDAYSLANQPFMSGQTANPMALLPWQESASACHTSTLQSDWTAFQKEHLSKDAAKKLRQKSKRIETLGEVRHIVADSSQERRAVLDAFLTQKHERFDEKNIANPFDDPAMQRFLDVTTAVDGGDAAIELHALYCGERIVATYGGGRHRGHFHAMFNSFTSDVEIGKCSPGDLLLRAMLEKACGEGLSGFDLGIGEARYKQSWCDSTIPLFDTFLAMSARGHVLVAAQRLAFRAKRAIKQNPDAWRLAQRLLGRR